MGSEKVNSWIIAFGLITILFNACQQQTTEVFTLGKIWPDNNGVHINAHGGGILYHKNTYYWYYEQYIRQNIPGKEEIDDFLYNSSWAKFDPELEYILGNHMPHDGIE